VPAVPSFGATVRRLREAKGISQEGLADLAGLDRTYVSGVERGVRNPTLKVIYRLAEALGADVSSLFQSASRDRVTDGEA
jgi:transcriptional regulator with XRE-family HTH domain